MQETTGAILNQPSSSTVQNQNPGNNNGKPPIIEKAKSSPQTKSPKWRHTHNRFEEPGPDPETNLMDQLGEIPSSVSSNQKKKSSSNQLQTSSNIARDSLSSPGVISTISCSVPGLPPGFDGSSVPLKPVSASVKPKVAKELDPFDPPEKLPSFMVLTKPVLDGFIEGQLISLSISSNSSSDKEDFEELDNEKVMEELKVAFELHQKHCQEIEIENEKQAQEEFIILQGKQQSSTFDGTLKTEIKRTRDTITLVEDATNTPSLMEKFLNSQCVANEELGTDIPEDANLGSEVYNNEEMTSPVLTETSGEYKVEDTSNSQRSTNTDKEGHKSVSSPPHGGFQLATITILEPTTFIPPGSKTKPVSQRDYSSPKQDIVERVSKDADVLKGSSSAPSNLGNPLVARTMRSFEEKNKIIQNLSASSPDTNIAISQYRGKNEMGEEDELLTVEAELPCDYPRLDF